MITYTPSLGEMAKENPLAKSLLKDLRAEGIITPKGVYKLEWDSRTYYGESLRECQEVLTSWKLGQEPTFSMEQSIAWRREEFGS